MIINNFDDFLECIQKSQEEKEYIGGGDSKYEEALRDLLERDYQKYQDYNKRLHKKFAKQTKRVEIEDR